MRVYTVHYSYDGLARRYQPDTNLMVTWTSTETFAMPSRQLKTHAPNQTIVQPHKQCGNATHKQRTCKTRFLSASFKSAFISAPSAFYKRAKTPVICVFSSVLRSRSEAALGLVLSSLPRCPIRKSPTSSHLWPQPSILGPNSQLTSRVAKPGSL